MTEPRWQRPWRKSPAALFLPPPILHDRYTCGPCIERGGHARVYRGWDTQRKAPVILKRAYVSEKQCDALCYEAHLLETLHHPLLPAFIEYFEEDGRSYLVETWMAGRSLDHLRFFTFRQILWIGQQMCEVLVYLHQQHLVHRDIAPGNILLDREHHRLSLLDLGLARLFLPSPHLREAPDTLSLLAGTPGYVAPEQWEQGTISPAADIYSLGMVLLCALTDRQPEDVVAVPTFAHLWDDPRSVPSEVRLLLTLLDRMLGACPEARPPLSEVSRLLSHLSGTL